MLSELHDPKTSMNVEPGTSNVGGYGRHIAAIDYFLCNTNERRRLPWQNLRRAQTKTHPEGQVWRSRNILTIAGWNPPASRFIEATSSRTCGPSNWAGGRSAAARPPLFN